MKKACRLLAGLLLLVSAAVAQTGLPTDYLPASFHAARRDSLRSRMPAHSVAVIFAYPTRTFSNDVSYPYHPNPDLYYFSGYREPNAVLFIFKEEQTGPDHTRYKDLFFIQKRDPQAEQWTGRRMGVEAVKKQLGFTMVYDGAAFNHFPLDLSGFKILFDNLPIDVPNDPSDSADLYDLIVAFREKAAIPADFNPEANELLGIFEKYANAANLQRFMGYFKQRVAGNDRLAGNELVKAALACRDSAGIAAVRQKIKEQQFSPTEYTELIASLREIKTPEEMNLLRKSIEISSIAHAEAMKAIEPGMSELELQGLQEYVHKKLGAEYVGYPSIVGSGENGCILHYEENTRMHAGAEEMVLMDVGAEYHGYSADVTRTVPVSGKFTPNQKAIYNLVYEAQEAVMKLCKEGTPFAALNEKATEVLTSGLLKLGIISDKKDIALYYPHGCSHFLGLDVHDAGNYDQNLKENMVITVEPGIYISPNSACDKKWWGIAVRIEDDVRVGKEAPELLSYLAPRKAEDVEKMAAQKSALNNLVLPPLPAAKKGF